MSARANSWVIAFLCLILGLPELTAQISPAGTLSVSAPSNSQPTTTTASPGPSSASGNESLPSAPSAIQSGWAGPQERKGTSNDRLFWTLPNFLTVENARRIPPLTSKQKFKVVLRSAFDPVEYPYVGFLAGISQANDSEPGFGQGAAGYAKRFGSAFADNTMENFMTGAILPSVLHQDPRYFQLGHGSFRHRLGYAISRVFLTRSDSGQNQFNASEVLGSAISSAIGTYSYHPRQDRTATNTVSVWWTQIGWDTVAISVKEFWPDIRRKLQKRHRVGSSPRPENPHGNSGR